MKKLLKCIFIIIFLVITQITVFSYDENEVFGKYQDELKENIPEEARKYLDDHLLDELESESAAYALDIGFWQRTLFKMINELLSSVLKDFSLIFGIVILISLLSAMRNTISSAGIAKALSYISTLCLAAALYRIILVQWDKVDRMLDTLNIFMNSILPAVTAMYIAGGNVTAATVNSGAFLVVLNIMQNICRYLLYPMLSICFGLAFVSAITGNDGVRLSGISELVRKTFTGILGFMMTFLTFILSYQTVFAAGADNMAVKTIKYAIGNMIPMVGGAVSESVKVIMGGLSAIKNSFGTIAVIVVVIMVVPVFISLYMTRFCLSVSGTAAEMTGCEKEAKFLADIKNLCNFAMAICASAAVFFIFGLTVFIKTASAVTT